MDSYYEGHWDIKPSIYRGIFVCLRAAASIKSTQAGTNKGDGVYNNKKSTKETKINSIFFITARSLITSLHRGSWEGLKLGSTDNTAWIWKMMWDSSWRIPGQSNANYCGCRLWQRRRGRRQHPRRIGTATNMVDARVHIGSSRQFSNVLYVTFIFKFIGDSFALCALFCVQTPIRAAEYWAET